MKKITVILILTAMVLTLFSCGEQESPPAYLPYISYDSVPLQTYSVLINSSDDTAEADGLGSEYSPAELIKMSMDNIPFTEISAGKIELVNGSDKNVEFGIFFEGAYAETGEKTEYTEDALSTLTNGKYVICARVTEKRTGESYTARYIFAGIIKN